MGGDICHFGGIFRPSPSYPLPDPIPTDTLYLNPGYFPSPCPCSIFTEQHPVLLKAQNDDRKPEATPFYEISTHKTSAYVDPATAQESASGLVGFDASPSVMICLSHDGTLLRYLPTVNDSPDSDINDWKAQGWKEKCHWGWLNELARGGQAARRPIVEGFWRDGRIWDTAKAELRELGESAFRSHGVQNSGSGL